MACTDLSNILNQINVFKHKSVKSRKVQTDVKEDIKNLVKSIYDYTKTQDKDDKKVKRSALPELIVEDFDDEQIWQQIELQNSECWDQLVWDVANCISTKTDLQFPITTAKVNSNSINESDHETPMSEGDQSDSEQESETENESPKRKKKISIPKSKVRPSIVDDQFFKLQEMEKFLINEEKEGRKTGSDSEESIDMFEDMDDDNDSEDEEGGTKAMYNDFFSQEGEEYNAQNGDYEEDENEDDNIFENGADENVGKEEDENLGNEEEDDDLLENGEAEEDDESEESEHETPKKKDKKVRFASTLSSDDNSEDSDDSEVQPAKKQPDKKKSDFELRQQRLKQQIERLEEKTLSEAPWQLKGEVDATKRPQNSLLEEVVDFDLTTRPAPIITEQTTETLEDIIRRRIKDKAFDDVEKKEKPVEDAYAFRKPVILNQAKSEHSLAQVYEMEYLKQKQALSGDVEDEKEPEAHTQIRNDMNKLFAKLDALCHYHYTPKAPQAEVKIVSNTPAISMEEVAPIATSDGNLLAPEEIKKKHRGELMSKEERTQTDKKRERRKKKKLQRGKTVSKVTEHRSTQKGTEADDKTLKTSKAFFQQLQDDSTSLIKKKRNVKNKGQ